MFIAPNPLDRNSGYLACDWSGCPATSPMFRRCLGTKVEGWHGVAVRSHMRSVVGDFCDDHVSPARAAADALRRP